MAIGEGRVQLGQKTNAFDIEGLTGSHDDARLDFCSLFHEPARALDLSLQDGAIECVLMIACSEFGTGLNDFEPAQIGCVAHGRTPVPAPDGQMQHFGCRAQNPDHRGAVGGTDGFC